MAQLPGLAKITGYDDLRRVRGYLLSTHPERRVHVTEVGGRKVYAVPSEHQAGVFYDVFIDEDGAIVCTCRDFKDERKPCKHGFEVIDRYMPDAKVPVNPDLLLKITSRAPAGKKWYADARRFPKVYFPYKEGLAESTRRDHAYMEQDVEVERLLVDLAMVLNRRHPAPVERGRPTLPAGDRVLVAALRCFHKKSMRASKPLLARLEDEKKIAFAPGKTAMVDYSVSSAMLELLLEAIGIATNPFRLMEETAIIDSTGESPFFVSNWRLSDYGDKNFQNNTEWLKLHAIIGRESKAILSFAITPYRGTGVGDVSLFAPLLKEIVARDFSSLKYIVGDNTYLTGDAWSAAKSLGVTLVPCFKGKNFNQQNIPHAYAAPAKAFADANPEIYDDLARSRNIIEGLFSAHKRNNPRIGAIGTAAEREARIIALEAARSAKTEAENQQLNVVAAKSSMYMSRMNELYVKILCQVLRATVHQEHLRNRRISYSKGSVFSHVRETIDA